MSAEPAGDEIREETTPTQPLISPHPFTRFRPVVAPALFVSVIVCVVIFAGIPFLNMLRTGTKNYEKFRQDSARAYSRQFQVPAVPPHNSPGK
jgi:hypothetical protein